MKIQFLSDLHEKYIDIQPKADCLALLGDIGDPFTTYYEKFIDNISKKFKNVFIITGNREYYFRSIPETDEKITSICSKYENVHFLNNSSVIVDGHLIVGSTLWTKIDAETALRINDFNHIRTSTMEFLNVETHNNIHKKAVEYIEEQSKQDLPTIILTHHAPIKEMNGNCENMPLWRAFCSDLSHIQGSIKVWLSGHTQKVMRINKNGIVYASNCMGFKRHQDFKENSVIEL